MKRRYKNELAVGESGGVGVGIISVLIFSIATLYLTGNLWVSSLLFLLGTLVVNGGLLEIIYAMKRPRHRPPAHPLHGTRNFVSPYGDDDD